MKNPFTGRNNTNPTGVNANDVANMFTTGVHQVTPAGHGFEDGQVSNLQPVVNMLIRKFMVPWLLSVLKKYTEPQFHAMMSQTYIDSYGRTAQGRDFVTDFEQNHRMRMNAFMKLARRNRRLFNVDVEYEANAIVRVLRQRGWTVYPHESECFRQTLHKFMKRIYS